MEHIISKLRKYEIQIRKAINSHMQGDFHSIFKGSGLEFDGVREYHYGDDTRSIDWNVSAKGHGTFVKTFKEEKEQTVFFLLDISASQEIGTPGAQKVDIGKEITGVLTLSAIKEQNRVGLLTFSDQKEKFVKSGKGVKHGYAIINELYKHKPKSTKTDINTGIKKALEIITRKSVVILISDFIDNGYEQSLRLLAKKHDLVVIHLKDDRETQLPNLGIVPVYDKESQKTVWVNTSSAGFRKKLEKTYSVNKGELEKFCRKNQINYLEINTKDRYVPQLIKLFKIRNKTFKSE
ncbi:uncharacterized protein DUF58 [Roseivirga pacifica]|uniref:VWFA domain-containing protein n=1 Tax=Roseivirga pacifica TaxID=1267423 RepID=A0A1I0P787_9BACT|nr:DUF58 domain-containing protein [Roseivirga pacifica]MCO6360283.1 DUF58 domain-containing protein [Roseivirga pacifica]MCO6367654.1 DUF58 domain-containing protein [Roseivirga pacifica]MCO6369814.1 DUF58 domain-containing protein [Roseivirga pacifica]MCO6375311.1 DUF58 domain-containing protein [Roseivirga pacifica]MCO6380569.1 DUF58 domain-containing protein [Roseivirga pacifica]